MNHSLRGAARALDRLAPQRRAAAITAPDLGWGQATRRRNDPGVRPSRHPGMNAHSPPLLDRSLTERGSATRPRDGRGCQPGEFLDRERAAGVARRTARIWPARRPPCAVHQTARAAAQQFPLRQAVGARRQPVGAGWRAQRLALRFVTPRCAVRVAAARDALHPLAGCGDSRPTDRGSPCLGAGELSIFERRLHSAAGSTGAGSS